LDVLGAGVMAMLMLCVFSLLAEEAERKQGCGLTLLLSPQNDILFG